MNYTTEQEAFWAGEFGTEYIRRNTGDALLASNINFFSKALHGTRGIRSCIEFGANIGMNLKALRLLLPGVDAHAIEINADAAQELRGVITPENVYNTSILEICSS
jgi:pseudaminic acid biosynthesis-associated methylase